MQKMIVALLAMLGVLIPVHASAQLWTTDTDCGAEGYACLNGRHCSSERCSPAWQDMSSSGAPAGSIIPNVEPLDGKIAVVGGCDAESNIVTGGIYTPSTDSWQSMPAPNTGRQFAVSASGNGGLYLFGGLTTCWDPYTLATDLEFLDSPTGSWSVVESANAPSPRYNASMIWTGTQLFLYGGSDSEYPALNTGGLLTPGNDWSPVTCDESWCARGGQFDLWKDGSDIRVWGGLEGYGEAPQAIAFDTGPETWSNSWSTPEGGPIFSEDLCTPQIGGATDGVRRVYYLGLDQVVWTFDRLTSSWASDSAWPVSLSTCASSTWLDGELFAWSGDGGQYGGRYQPPAPGLL